MKLVLAGVVSFGDTYRSKKSAKKGAIYLNELDILPTINEYFRNTHVSLSFWCESYQLHCEGTCLVDLGFLDREYPLEPDFFHIDREDILAVLYRYEQQLVTLIFETEEDV